MSEETFIQKLRQLVGEYEVPVGNDTPLRRQAPWPDSINELFDELRQIRREIKKHAHELDDLGSREAAVVIKLAQALEDSGLFKVTVQG